MDVAGGGRAARLTLSAPDLGAIMPRAIAALALAAILLTGCAASPAPRPTATEVSKSTPAARTVVGSVRVAATDEQFAAFDEANNADPLNTSYDCVAAASFSDVAEGAQIVASDASGEVVAIGSLEAGQYGFTDVEFFCEFPFSIEDIVLDEKFYGLSVGNVFRGDVQFSEEAMRVGPRLYLG